MKLQRIDAVEMTLASYPAGRSFTLSEITQISLNDDHVEDCSISMPLCVKWVFGAQRFARARWMGLA